MALIVLLFLLELILNVRAFRPPVRTARRCGPAPDQSTTQRGEGSGSLLVRHALVPKPSFVLRTHAPGQN